MHDLQIVDAAQLAAAYSAADYAVMIDGDALRLRVGEPATDIEAYWPAGHYLFITAWNPASMPHSDATNETADALLVGQLDTAGVRRVAAWSQGQDGDWREPGWLVADLDRSRAFSLAQEFGQAAVLTWQRGQPVRLQMLLDRPVAGAGGDCIAWIDE